MRSVKAVLAGFLVTTVLIVLGGWAFGRIVAPAMRGEYYAPTLSGGLVALAYTAAAIVVGAYVTVRLHNSNQTLSGFIVAQAFFGFGLIREFWSTEASWYTVAALVLVIPCAIIGRAFATNIANGRTARGLS
jgi:Ca2+/H+ antiporter